ncbi:MAG: hypothetical protein PHR51_00700 [Patescibacteria group bacterium]|nr:hypothetical protein [Patescibacteria group bacterium]
MKFFKVSLLVVALWFTLGAASCSRDISSTNIGQVAIATGLNLYNQPSNELAKVAASTETIYAAVEVFDPTPTTRIRVRWYRWPSELIASEDFVGQRSSANKFDYQAGAKSSFLASSIKKNDLTWALGEYKVEVLVNNNPAKSVMFDIVPDNEALAGELAAIVHKISTASALDDDFKISDAQTTFARNVDDIFVQTNIRGADAGTAVSIRVRYVKEDNIFATFSYEVDEDQDIVVDLERDRYGKLWSDRLWPEGAFEITVLVNNLEAASHTFLVKTG